MTRAAGVARSFLLVCFSADAFNFHPVCVAHGVAGGSWGVPERERQGRKKRREEGVMEPWVKY